MTGRPIRHLAVVLLGMAAPACVARAAPVAATRPNIVLFISDDHGWEDSGAYGDKVVRTPNLDRLASEGLRFTRAFAETPLCTPSRSVIYTGMSPVRSGGHVFGDPIRPGIRTLPAYFKELGYHTAFFGKFHVSPRGQFPYDRFSGNELEAPAFLNHYKEAKPLLLVVCSNRPHLPWAKNKAYNPADVNLPPNFVDTPETRRSRTDYYTDVTEMDRQLGTVMRALQSTGAADRTLLLYTTDQGANWPFGKWCLYDGGMRVPLIARWPAKIKKNSTTNAMVSLADLLPTLIEAAGGTPPTSPEAIDGLSFLPVLTGARQEHRAEVFAAHHGVATLPNLEPGGTQPAQAAYPSRCVRTATHKLIVNLHPEYPFVSTINGIPPHDTKWKQYHSPYWVEWVDKAKTDPAAEKLVTAYVHRPAEELYDLAADPYELNNLAADPALDGVRRELRRKLAEWCQQQGDTEPVEYLRR
jgi:N-sulfoglucosamine sulfohydrolase